MKKFIYYLTKIEFYIKTYNLKYIDGHENKRNRIRDIKGFS